MKIATNNVFENLRKFEKHYKVASHLTPGYPPLRRALKRSTMSIPTRFVVADSRNGFHDVSSFECNQMQ